MALPKKKENDKMTPETQFIILFVGLLILLILATGIRVVKEYEREKHARVIKTEGEFESSKKLSEAAELIRKNPSILELRRMQMIYGGGGRA